MVPIKFEIVLFCCIFLMCKCVRRIKDGEEVSFDKRYVVYLVKAPVSNKIYDAWLCGGALVSTTFIVTSAACVDDVEFLYAIAGYKKYVTDQELDIDQCTREKKKKVIYTCVPLKYQLNYHQVAKWSFIDIALAKVESPYNLNDQSYGSVCSYTPAIIAINFEDRFQNPGTDALVYGWGHTDIWRQPGDSGNYNQEVMRYAATKIIDKQTCKKQYANYANMSDIIDQYMICTLERGEINDKGQLVLSNPSPKQNGCQMKNLMNEQPVPLNGEEICEDNDNVENAQNSELEFILDATRREKSNLNKTMSMDQSRKFGICQNDHGGPLVTWVGGNEVLIGVASVFKVTSEYKCVGPYLFTSTQCNGAFLDCILSNQGGDNKNRRAICDSPPIERGYDTVEKHISWRNHPAGPADNEREESNQMNKAEEPNHPQLSEEKKKRIVNYHNMLKNYKQRFDAVAVRPQRPIGK